MILGIHLFLLTGEILGKNPHGVYFSEPYATENGFLLIAIEIYEEKSKLEFRAQELRFHKERGYEEVILSGSVHRIPDAEVLTPKDCQIRGTKVWGQKMGLVRRFDCEHLRFYLGTLPDRILSESLLGTKTRIRMRTFLPGLEGRPVAIQWDPRNFPEGIWGLHLNGLGGKNPAKVYVISSESWVPFTEKASSSRILFWERTFSN